jgi:O-antigen/teichoic acid export membrane protein
VESNQPPKGKDLPKGMIAPAAPAKKNYLLATLLGSFWNVLQFITSFGVGIVVSILLTRHFGTNTFGFYSYLNWFSSIIILCLNFGIQTTLQTWVPKYYFTGELPRASTIARQLLKIQGVILAAGVVVLIPLVFIWHRFVSFPPHLFTILMLVNLVPMLTSMFNIFLSTLLVSLQRFKESVLIIVTGQLLTLVSALLVVIFHFQILGLLILLSIVNVTMLVLFIARSRDILRADKGRGSENPEVKKMLKFSGWAYINIILSAVIWDKSEFFFLGKYHVGKAIAIYGIAYTLSILVTTILDPIVSVFTTMLSELVAKRDWDRVRLIIHTFAKYVSILLLPCITLAFALSKYVINIVYGPEYILVASIFPVLLLSSVLVRIFAPAWSIPNYMHDLNKIVPRNLLVALLNISLDIILIPRYGIWGATIANVATQLVAIAYFGFFMRRYQFRLFTKEYFKILILNVALFLAVALALYLRKELIVAVLTCAFGIMIYITIIYKKFFNLTDRQLILNSIITIKNR